MSINYYTAGFNIQDAFSGEFGEHIKQDLKSTNQVCFIPSNPLKPEKILNWQKIFDGHFSKQGIHFKKSVCVFNDDDEKAIADKVGKADFVILVGGNPIVQMQFLKSKNIDKILQDFKGIVLGFSAGAMCMGQKILMPPMGTDEYPNQTNINGINLSKFSIFPHFNFDGDSMPDKIVTGDGVAHVKDILKLNEFTDHLYLLQDHSKLGFIRECEGQVTLIDQGVFEVNNNKIQNITKPNSQNSF